MNFLKTLAEQAKPAGSEGIANPQQGGEGGGFGGMLGKLTGGTAREGGAEGEKQEDYLDKAIDIVQQKIGQGDQVTVVSEAVN
jgi:hypothetical protein